MKKSEILKKARKLIESSKELYICLAIEDTIYSDAIPTSRKGRELIKWIEGMLGPGDYGYARNYSEWLRDFHPEYFACDDRYFKQGRLQWMDWMINYWEERGE